MNQVIIKRKTISCAKWLECSCCGGEFRGRQHWDHDTGFGTCASCCSKMIEKFPFEVSRIRKVRASQWPELAYQSNDAAIMLSWSRAIQRGSTPVQIELTVQEYERPGGWI